MAEKTDKVAYVTYLGTEKWVFINNIKHRQGIECAFPVPLEVAKPLRGAKFKSPRGPIQRLYRVRVVTPDAGPIQKAIEGGGYFGYLNTKERQTLKELLTEREIPFSDNMTNRRLALLLKDWAMNQEDSAAANDKIKDDAERIEPAPKKEPAEDPKPEPKKAPKKGGSEAGSKSSKNKSKGGGKDKKETKNKSSGKGSNKKK